MKKIFNYLCYTAIVAVVAVGCKKDEDQVVFDPSNAKAPTLTVNNNTVVLDPANNDKNALTFTVGKADYGFPAGITYTLEVAQKGTNFATPKIVALTSNTTKSYTVKELNNFISTISGVVAGSNNAFEVRVKSSITTAYPELVSNVITVNITPYFQLTNYPKMYVPGSYQGWSPDKAETIASIDFTETYYEGYINFPDATTDFKFTPKPNWDADYGDVATSGDSGKLKEKGSDIKIKGAGYYYIKVDINALTWSAVKTTWGIVGDAANGWDNDVAMTYDTATKTWSATTNLTGGKKIKFRANKDWAINFGDGDEKNLINPDGFLDAGKDDIKIVESGSYTITLDLSNAGNYSYKLKKN